MSDFATHDWSSGDTYSDSQADDLETRIDAAFTSHESRMDGIDAAIAALDARIDALEALTTKLPPSPNGTQAADYALQTTDAGTNVPVTGNTTITVAAFGAALPAGTIIEIQNNGSGVVTIAGAGGVTIHPRDNGAATLSQQWATARLRKTATNVWSLNGEIG